MNQLSYYFNEKINLSDKILILGISLIPLSLAISIFFADLLASICGSILIYFFLSKKNLDIFIKIKKEIIFFSIFYIIILISYSLSEYKSETFLASFFYFRYFLLSLTIFYLLKKYDFYFKIFFFSVIISIGIVVFDSFLQQIIGFNLFGYPKEGTLTRDSLIYLTSFFNDEKKLGSYLVRFTPLILSLIYFYKSKISIYYDFLILILIGTIVFFSSERTAFFLLFVVYFFYISISEKKLYFLIITIFIFTFLFNFNSDTRLVKKYTNFTLQQIGLVNLFDKKKNKETIIRYYSEEHENLSFTGLIIFKNNYLFGSGVKTFYQECTKLQKAYPVKENKRQNKLVCSTHAHNTYIQILSEIGFFGFLMVFIFFVRVLYENFKLILIKKKSRFEKAYFFINLNILINILPLIPSGSFFNNWMSLIIFFPLGFWLYIKEKVN